ncbi:MAG TPA: class I SAM-dependent methyltransferase [Stellaceae bacterium]|nr:class I SAM-dependent methyltransferase [Stellaceae bacterium]
MTAEQSRINDDFMRLWHEVLPQRYGIVERFNHTYPVRAAPPAENSRTLEIGAGLGEHIAYEDLSTQEYHALELRPIMAEAIEQRFPSVSAVVADCQKRLPFPDNHFDRVVAIHVLEHLPDLPKALDEIRRVLRPGGSFAIVYPCDPGLAYEVARKISAERIFRRTYHLPYGWLIRREHINSPGEIETELGKRFTLSRREYFPLGIPVISLNLCVGVLAQ